MKYSSHSIIKHHKKQQYGPKKPSKRRLRKSVRRFIILFVLVFLFAVLNKAGFMNVKDVVVISDDEIDAQEIIAQFGLNDYAGMNFLWVPFKKIRWMLESSPKIQSSEIAMTHFGKMRVKITLEKPELFLLRQWGYYALSKDFQFIRTLPPFSKISDIPIKFSDEHLFFDSYGRPVPSPWKQILSKNEVNDRELMLALGFRDLLALHETIYSQVGMPKVQYVAYHERYGLMMKCEGKPLILLGYGNNLMVQFTRALKILSDPNFPFGEDKYVDIRFDEYQCVNYVDNLEGFSAQIGNWEEPQ